MNSKSWMAGVVVASAIGSSALGQDAVQWRVEDGGNGHWYRKLGELRNWPDAKARCEELGGHLATLTTATEWNWVVNATAFVEGYVGAFQDALDPAYQEPYGGWKWVTGEPFQFQGGYMLPFDDCPGAAPPSCACGSGAQDVLFVMQCCGHALNDSQDGTPADCNMSGDVAYPPVDSIVEWSADCNADGIVDYGQIRAGELVDTNANNIPDCCEQATECPNPIAPLEWRIADGGNGHWYGLRIDPLVPVADFNDRCAVVGAHLASITTTAEHQFVLGLMLNQGWLSRAGWPAIGLRRPDTSSPWEWVTNEPVVYLPWAPGEPGAPGVFAQLWGTAAGPNLTWSANGNPFISSGVIEWSADCNADGIVDYGQIRAGELVDTNANNIPDCCEQGSSCGCIADLDSNGSVDGIDLAVILNNWGTNGGKDYPNADIDGDGTVAASDLSEVLNAWGPCR